MPPIVFYFHRQIELGRLQYRTAARHRQPKLFIIKPIEAAWDGKEAMSDEVDTNNRWTIKWSNLWSGCGKDLDIYMRKNILITGQIVLWISWYWQTNCTTFFIVVYLKDCTENWLEWKTLVFIWCRCLVDFNRCKLTVFSFIYFWLDIEWSQA